MIGDFIKNMSTIIKVSCLALFATVTLADSQPGQGHETGLDELREKMQNVAHVFDAGNDFKRAGPPLHTALVNFNLALNYESECHIPQKSQTHTVKNIWSGKFNFWPVQKWTFGFKVHHGISVNK